MTMAHQTPSQSPLRMVDGTMPALGEKAQHPRGGILGVLPARNQAGRVHEQPDHRSVHLGGHVDLTRGSASPGRSVSSRRRSPHTRWDRSALIRRLYGFNGVLVGLALALFLTPAWDVPSSCGSSCCAALGADGAASRVRRSVGAPIHVGTNSITLLFLITGLHVAHGRLGVIVEPAAPVSGGAGVQTAPGRAPTPRGTPTRWRS